jgi:NAD+ synthetase
VNGHLPTVATVQHNPTVGAVGANRDSLLDGIETAVDDGARLVVTPELALLGYPPRDLLHRDATLAAERAAVDDLRAATDSEPKFTLVVGHTAPNPDDEGPPLVNVASVFRDGQQVAQYQKRLLPTYDVFDEHRYFDPGDEPVTVAVGDSEVGLTICEDAWYDHEVTGQRRHGANPIADYEGVDLLVNISASPFHVGKPGERETRFAGHATDVDAPVVFANQFGGNDDLLFDGASFVVSAAGELVARSPFGETGVTVTRWDTAGDPPIAELPDETAQLRQMLGVGIRDYLSKTGFDRVIVGLSGGIDSSVTAALAAEALGPEQVHGVMLPSRITAESSRTDAAGVADGLGIRFGEAEIDEVVTAFESAVGALSDREELAGITRENLQARARGTVLMGLANDERALVLTPDNKSEAAVGYCTLYGDAVGAIAPLGDCTKRRVYELARSFNADPPAGATETPIPTRVLEKAPTAELAEDQSDEDDIPPYDVIDAVVERYVGEKQSIPEIVADTGATREQVETVIRRLTRSEFKRGQTPPALRVTRKAFDSGWRYPIAASYDALFEA